VYMNIFGLRKSSSGEAFRDSQVKVGDGQLFLSVND
jgi:hypothetical protein